MKKFALASIFVFCLISLAAAQTNPPAEWIRVQSDDGEFSAEVPAAYDFYGDKEGFIVSRNTKTFQLKDMRMLNVFSEKTLISFEAYETNRSNKIADVFADQDEHEGQRSQIKIGELKITQILIKKDGLYAVRRYLTTKTHIYVLTAGSRMGETAALKRFLDSVVLKTAETNSVAAQAVDSKVKTVVFSALKVSQLEIDKNPKPFDKNAALQPAPPREDNSLPVALIVKPVPSYTESARRVEEEGLIRMRLTFSTNGSITKVGFLSTLGAGLLRQATFAAIRFKFIPAEKKGALNAVTKLVEYNFDIY